ncbi:MAG: AIR carboxylase family protein, partial [Planctomycetales bacterium]
MTEASDTCLVGIIMGSQSDWETMRHARLVLDEFGIANECKVLSAHRTPDATREYVLQVEPRGM